MLLMDKANLAKSASIRKQFHRRKDLTEKIRMQIAISAYLAQEYSQWGIITSLARQHDVSRPFIYDLILKMKDSLSATFGLDSDEQRTDADVQNALAHILSLKMEGICSQQGISTCMKRFGLKYNSIGFISHYLNTVGSLLPSTLTNEENTVKLVVFASDEIFSNNMPILVTVDPVSSAILRIELSDTRKAKDWVEHWECIEDNGYTAIYLVSDEGTGLTSGHSHGLSDRKFQPDTFHAIAHKLGIWVKRFEKKAYQAIEEEYYRLRVFDSAKSDVVIAKRIKAYESAVAETTKQLEIYEDFVYLYSNIVKELHLFDLNGDYRKRLVAEENIEAILDLLDEFGNTSLSDVVKKIRTSLPQLLNYFDQADIVMENLKNTGIDDSALKALCAGWQWHRGGIKSKKAPRRNYCRDKERFCLDIAEGYLQEQYEVTKYQVYDKLNSVVQSSAMVECINSIIRPYLNASRNHITQEMLNLIMFYHNHRRYKSGERSGKTPYELLSGKPQGKDWIELLFEKIEKIPTPVENLFNQSLAQEKACEMLACHNVCDDYVTGRVAS